MAIDTEVYFCKNTKLYQGSEDTYYFANESARQSFFIGKSSGALHVTAMSFQRHDKKMRVAIPDADLEPCDYLMYRNTSYYNKWFYCFITGVEYINDEVSEVSFEIDNVQTWLPSLTFQNCLVSRETPASDGLFANIQPEPDLGGELFTFANEACGAAYNSSHKWADGSTVQAGYIVLAVKRIIFETASPITGQGVYWDHMHVDPTEQVSAWDGQQHNIGTLSVPIDNYRGVGSSYAYYCFAADADGFQACATLLNDYVAVRGASTDDVAACFMCPACALPPALVNAFSGGSVSTSDVFLCVGESLYSALNGNISTGSNSYNSLRLYELPTSAGGINSQFSVYQSTGLIFGGYVPKNKKLFNAPFYQIVLDNGQGEQQSFSPERFSTTTPKVYFYPHMDSTVQVAACVDSYNGDNKLLHILQLDGYPTFSWNSDSYAEWSALFGSYQAQKAALGQVSAGLSMISQTGNFAGQVVTGNVGGAMGSLGGMMNTGLNMQSAMLDYQQQIAQARNASPKSHGSSRGNLTRTQLGSDYITVLQRSLKAQDAERVDNFFTKFGYAVNRFKTLDFTGRTRFYYVKTADFNATGNVPAIAKADIAGRFSQGLRFWRGDYLGDYSVTNSISA